MQKNPLMQMLSRKKISWLNPKKAGRPLCRVFWLLPEQITVRENDNQKANDYAARSIFP
jgi:hypothetical protein